VTSLIQALPSVRITRLSGYRSKPYQQHLYDIKLAHKQLYDLTSRDPASAAACTSLASWLDFEIDKHCLNHQAGKAYLSVNPPADSAHTACAEPVNGDPCRRPSSRALDLAVSERDRTLVASRLPRHGLALCSSDSAFHVQQASDGSCRLTQNIRAAVSSARAGAAGVGTDAGPSDAVVRILVTDGEGRRVGYDPVNDINVNEFPAGTATYTGGETGSAEILISSQGGGTYTVTAIGAASGEYEIVLQSTDNEHGDVVVERVVSGIATAGEPTPAASIDIVEEVPPAVPPRVRGRAVRH
jgi:hypothetical protein